MKNFKEKNDSAPGPPSWLQRAAAAWHWLIEPPAAIVQPERRLQVRLLMAMLLILFSLGLISLVLSRLGVYTVPAELKTSGSIFDWITVAAIILFATGYALSRSIHYYPLAAGLSVGSVLAATFVSAVINPAELRTPFFLVLGGVIAGLFLSARMTALVFVVTFIALLLFPLLVPGFDNIDHISAFFFIVTIGALVVMAAALRQRYLDQIDWQTHQLLEREAQLRELSIRDPLTGLFNRRYMEESLALEMLRAVRRQVPIGIIMADIDHFKRFNDIHGHAAGDAILVQIANFFRAAVRSSDATCRYGGEEFVIILPETTLETTLNRAELIVQGARRLEIQFDGQALGTVTLSLGVAIFPQHGSTMDAILGAADHALYRAKNEGRDRVVVAE